MLIAAGRAADELQKTVSTKADQIAFVHAAREVHDAFKNINVTLVELVPGVGNVKAGLRRNDRIVEGLTGVFVIDRGEQGRTAQFVWNTHVFVGPQGELMHLRGFALIERLPHELKTSFELFGGHFLPPCPARLFGGMPGAVCVSFCMRVYTYMNMNA